MKYRYSKFTGEDLDGIDLEELLSRLSDLLLSSGFEDGYSMPGEDGLSMQSLHDAIMEALLNGGLLSEETLERLLGKDWQTSEDAEERLDELIRRIIEKLQHQGYVSGSPDFEAEREQRERGFGGRGQDRQFKFEITDKSLDFLGYRALRDLLGSIGKSSIGRHDTREMATAEAVRVRRHDEPRRKRNDPKCGDARPCRARAGRRGSWRADDRRRLPGSDGGAR